MKYSFLAALAMIAATAFSAQALEIGKPAPDFKATDTNKNEQSISGNKGKIVVLEWNNPGCPFVVKHYNSNNMQPLQQFALDKGVVWLTINSSAKDKEGYMNAEAANEYSAKYKAVMSSYILDHDGAIGHLYGAKTTPHMFVIDANGILVYEGAIDDKATTEESDIAGAKNYVKTALEELLAGKSVTTAQTRAYGCSVKY